MDRLACVRASPVDSAAREKAAFTVLCRFSPEIEPVKADPGTFWLNASGLDPLYPSLQRWAWSVRAALGEIGFRTAIVVGFSRFGTYALTRAHRGILVAKSKAEETALTRAVALARLGLSPFQIAGLRQLGKRTLGDLLTLPKEGLLERFGQEVQKLWMLGSGEAWDPLQPVPVEEPIAAEIDLDYGEGNALRLTFLAKRLLRSLLSELATKSKALFALDIALKFERGEWRTERVRPAEPTLDEAQLIDLVRLRLESLEMTGCAVAIRLIAEGVPASFEQLLLFAHRPRRDPAAADRALARLRAEFGPSAVARMRLKEGHLPEAQYSLEPMEHLATAEPGPDPRVSSPPSPKERSLVRRIYSKPIPLQARPVVGSRGCHLLGLGEAPATRAAGPYIISGGWWIREVHREYYFAETAAGRIFWVYFDKKRRSWFLHGEVE